MTEHILSADCPCGPVVAQVPAKPLLSLEECQATLTHVVRSLEALGTEDSYWLRRAEADACDALLDLDEVKHP